MLKKLGIAGIALALLLLLAPATAHARVHFGVYVGAPVYTGPVYPYYYDPYYTYPYSNEYVAPYGYYPYGYRYTYSAPYYYHGWRGRERQEWLRHERHEQRGRFEHRRGR